MTTLSISLADTDVERIAAAVAARLELPSTKRFYTVEAAATYTSLSPEAIRMAVKAGKLKARKGASGRLAFLAEDLDSFMGGAA